MRFVSPLLKRAIYPALHRTGFLNGISLDAGYAVVNYHGVVPSDYSSVDKFLDGNLVSVEVFRKQLQFLKAHYSIIQPEDFLAWVAQGKTLPARAVLVTCDDGLLNTLTEMFPVLQQEGVPCLFFVTAASCSDKPEMLWYEELYHLMRSKPLDALAEQLPADSKGEVQPPGNFQSEWWSMVKRASQLDAKARHDWMELVRAHSGGALPGCEERWRLLNSSELRKLSDAGMTIGAHTRTHPVLSLCREEEARSEIQGSKQEIEHALGRQLWAFAYPFGNPATMGGREFSLTQEAGFSCAFLNVEYWATAHPRFAIARTHVTADMSLAEFSAHLSGLHCRLQRAVGS